MQNIDIFGYPEHFKFEVKTDGARVFFLAQLIHQTCLGGMISVGFVIVIIISQPIYFYLRQQRGNKSAFALVLINASRHGFEFFGWQRSARNFIAVSGLRNYCPIIEMADSKLKKYLELGCANQKTTS